MRGATVCALRYSARYANAIPARPLINPIRHSASSIFNDTMGKCGDASTRSTLSPQRDISRHQPIVVTPGIGACPRRVGPSLFRDLLAPHDQEAINNIRRRERNPPSSATDPTSTKQSHLSDIGYRTRNNNPGRIGDYREGGGGVESRRGLMHYSCHQCW